jgi:hypothetical protein
MHSLNTSSFPFDLQTGLAANNYAIMGVHVIAGAQAIQTLRGGTESELQ